MPRLSSRRRNALVSPTPSIDCDRPSRRFSFFFTRRVRVVGGRVAQTIARASGGVDRPRLGSHVPRRRAGPVRAVDTRRSPSGPSVARRIAEVSRLFIASAAVDRSFPPERRPLRTRTRRDGRRRLRPRVPRDHGPLRGPQEVHAADARHEPGRDRGDLDGRGLRRARHVPRLGRTRPAGGRVRVQRRAEHLRHSGPAPVAGRAQGDTGRARQGHARARL
mmetsp:Transcript_6815/g.27855  ORF Transcript_6815/g.27855 Transcript_6815/m.27855 type:complete len:220 (+) Transcript_6815:599-1258(+)